MSLLCSTLGDHERLDCIITVGGIPSAAILLDGWDAVITDPENATQWTTAIAQGLVKVIKDIKGDIPASSPVETPNPVACGNENVYIGTDWVMNFKDFNVSAQNNEFYTDLKKQRVFTLAYVTCDNEMFIISGVNASVTQQIHSETNRELRRYEGMYKAFIKLNDDGPIQYVVPTGIFS